MKKLLLTSPKFEGEIIVIYGADMLLAYVDFRDAENSLKQIDYLIRKVPAQFTTTKDFIASMESTSLVVVEADYKVTFEMFFDEYGHKRNKARCIKPFERLSEANKVKAFVGIRRYNRHLQFNPWKNKMDPEQVHQRESLGE